MLYLLFCANFGEILKIFAYKLIFPCNLSTLVPEKIGTKVNVNKFRFSNRFKQNLEISRRCDARCAVRGHTGRVNRSEARCAHQFLTRWGARWAHRKNGASRSMS